MSSSGFDRDSESGQQLIRELAEASEDAMRRVAMSSDFTEDDALFARKMIAAAMRASAVAYCDNVSKREEEEKVKQAKTSKMSPELQKMIDEMNQTAIQHNYVYPPEPKEGAILIPTGGLEKCRCSPTCQETLMQPAYRVIEGEEKKLWIPVEEKPMVIVKEKKRVRRR